MRYLEDDPPELTLPTWTYKTAAGVAQLKPELLCNATLTHEVFEVDELPSAKEQDVDEEWTIVEFHTTESTDGIT